MRKKKIPKGARRLTARARLAKVKPADAEKAAARAAAEKLHQQNLARIERTFDDRTKKVKNAIKSFKARKSDKGRIIFVGARGGRIGKHSSRRGYAVYVNSKGRKIAIRQLSRSTGKVEKIPVPRKLNTIDLSRSPSKRAKREFLTARTNPIAGRELRKRGKGISSRGTRYAGKIVTDKFYLKADAVAVLAKELTAAANGQRSKKDFLVTIGLHVHETKTGRRHWIETQQRFSRQDSQRADEREVRQFFGRQIYAFLARELAERGLVLSGSARHIGSLSENRGNPRDEWRKDGFLWQGHDAENVKIESLEYRFDQLTLTK